MKNADVHPCFIVQCGMTYRRNERSKVNVMKCSINGINSINANLDGVANNVDQDCLTLYDFCGEIFMLTFVDEIIIRLTFDLFRGTKKLWSTLNKHVFRSQSK